MTSIDFRTTLSILGAVLRWYAVPFLAPVAVALLYGESPVPYAATMLGTLALGVGLERLERNDLREREAFLVVSLSWLSVGLIGAVPLFVEGTGVFASPVNAAFEGMSGITTTGATVIRDFGVHSRALLLWRQVLQWLGGLGILLLATAVLSRLSVAGAQLMESEARTEGTRLTPKIEDTAQIIVGIYVGLTALAVLVLFALGITGLAPEMTAYNAVAHALTSVATAGFSPEPESVGAFAPVVHWVIVVFMALGATSFVLLYALVRGDFARLRDSEEFRFYVGVLGVTSALVFGLLLTDPDYAGGPWTAVRRSVFQVTSVVTTTCFATVDFNTWSPAAKQVLFMCMFVGGMVGSTTCSIKALRWLIVLKAFGRDLSVASHRGTVRVVRLSGEAVDEETIRDVYAYTLVALILFLFATVLIVADGARTGRPVTEFEAITAAASTFFNIGPAFGRAGPFGTYAGFSRSSKVLMTLLMWIGRIEIIPVLVLLTPNFWR